MASISYFATARRSACDRCKKQKLRCSPEPHHSSDQPCGRCVRADVPCIRGYTRPRGYSAKVIGSGSEISHQKPISAASGPSLETAEPQLLHGSMDEMIDLYTTPTESISLSWAFGNDNDQYLAPLDDHSMEALATRSNENNISPFTDHFFLDHRQDDDINSLNIGSYASPGVWHVSRGSCGKASGLHQRRNTGMSSHNCPQPQWAEFDMRLCQLSLDLCRQIDNQVQSSAKNTPGLKGDAESPAGSTTFADAFRDALNSTEGFIGILQSLHSGTLSSAPSPPLRNSFADRHGVVWNPSRLACILNIESCYFRIVNLFDAHLANLHDQSRQESQDADTPPSPLTSPFVAESQSPPVLPGLHLAGFLVRQAGLQAKILCQVVQHQFETMERLLRLPARLRVSGCVDEDEDSDGALCELWVSNSPREKGGGCDELMAIQSLRERLADTRQGL